MYVHGLMPRTVHSFGLIKTGIYWIVHTEGQKSLYSYERSWGRAIVSSLVCLSFPFKIVFLKHSCVDEWNVMWETHTRGIDNLRANPLPVQLERHARTHTHV